MHDRVKVKHYYKIMFLLSLSLSLFKVFEYKANEVYSSFSEHNFPYSAYDIKYCENNTFSSIHSFAVKCRMFWVLNLFNSILNNVLFLVLSACVDILMIRFSNKLISIKSKMHCPHLDEAVKCKENLNKMIIVNGALFFFSHVPEFVVTVLLLVFKKRLAEFCYQFFKCTEIVEIAQTFHLVSIAFQFFVFKHFDHNFSRKEEEK